MRFLVVDWLVVHLVGSLVLSVVVMGKLWGVFVLNMLVSVVGSSVVFLVVMGLVAPFSINIDMSVSVNLVMGFPMLVVLVVFVVGLHVVVLMDWLVDDDGLVNDLSVLLNNGLVVPFSSFVNNGLIMV